jgi:hypothetical protein
VHECKWVKILGFSCFLVLRTTHVLLCNLDFGATRMGSLHSVCLAFWSVLVVRPPLHLVWSILTCCSTPMHTQYCPYLLC